MAFFPYDAQTTGENLTKKKASPQILLHFEKKNVGTIKKLIGQNSCDKLESHRGK